MKPTEKQIKKIAEELDCGMRCIFNTRNGELKCIIDSDSWDVADDEILGEDLKEIEQNEADYFEFEQLDTHESFRIMADFAENVDNEVLRNTLVGALNRPKPFRNFKQHIDNSGAYREQWFTFKNSRYIEYVKGLIEAYEERFDQ